MTPKTADPFFVGYFRKVPPEIRDFALTAGVCIVSALAVLAVVLPLGTIDPGAGRYANDLRGGVLTGVIDPLPYPILRVPAADGAPPRAVLLGGQEKVGVQDRVDVGAAVVELGGIFVRRGDIEMLLVPGNGAKASATGLPGFAPAPPVDLGRWRLTGEICDGKCQAGAMKPGRGLAHKACANLCITSGLPPVLVMDLPVEGTTVVLLAAADGGPLPAAMLDLTAIPIQVEGQLERRDDLLIFRIDPESVDRM
ncbi:MAG: hypothetical protein ACT4OK_22790 [Gemmobacter sp.]